MQYPSLSRCTYCCQEFSIQEDREHPLPAIDRICPDCKDHTHIYIFTNKKTGRDEQVRASNVELATLLAWKISPDLTFKVPIQPQERVANSDS